MTLEKPWSFHSNVVGLQVIHMTLLRYQKTWSFKSKRTKPTVIVQHFIQSMAASVPALEAHIQPWNSNPALKAKIQLWRLKSSPGGSNLALEIKSSPGRSN
jgi:hypothetical protein